MEADVRSLEQTIRLAKEVVMPQGAIFIRELLRQKRAVDPAVRIGVGKEEIAENLEAAIRLGAVTWNDLEQWLQEVEGWGRQHVYLYRCSVSLKDDPIWASIETLRERLAEVGLDEHWQSHQAPEFPAELVPANVILDQGRFELVWRQRRERWMRDADGDKDNEVIEGFTYEFRAFRQELSRAVMRFVLFPTRYRAALFVQLPLGGSHEEACRLARKTLQAIFDISELREADISKAIKSFDNLDLEEADKDRHGQVQSQNAKFGARGATVEFDADPAIVAWKRVKALRDVRRALQTRSFEGVQGKFIVTLRRGAGLNRDIVMSLAAAQNRVYFRAQMSADEIWVVLDQVLQHSR